jgi:hypothetical protein
VQFKGRAINLRTEGNLLLLKFAERLCEVGYSESLPKMEGRRMPAMFDQREEEIIFENNWKPVSLQRSGIFCWIFQFDLFCINQTNERSYINRSSIF